VSGSGGERFRGGGKVRRWALRGLQVALTVVVTYFIVRRVGLTAEDLAALDASWLRPAWGLLSGATGLLLLGFLVSALLWARIVAELGGGRIGGLGAARIYFVSNLGRYVPGKIWQIAGLAYLARRAGLSGTRAAAAAVLAQATSIAGACLLAVWALLKASGPLGAWGPWLAGGIVLVVLGVTVPALFRRLVDLLFRLEGREALVGTVKPDPGFGLRWILLFAGNWLVYAGAFALLAGSFGVEGGAVEHGTAFAAAYVLGYLMVFAPAGLGVREGFLVAFLEPAAGAGPAAALAVAARFWMTLVELIPALGLVAFSGAGGAVSGSGGRNGR